MPVSIRRALASAALLGWLLFPGCRAATIDPASIADAQLAARVKTAIVNDPEIGQFPIEVRVVQGVAYLTGPIRLPGHADRAAELARAVPGVTGVPTRSARRRHRHIARGPGPGAAAAGHVDRAG